VTENENASRPVNPFIAGAPVSGPEMFYGREDVFAFIRRNLIGRHRDTPIVLKGERRTGKTSVLYQVHRRLDPSYRCVSVDLHGLSLNGIGDLLNGIANSVSNCLRSDYGIDVPAPERSAFDADPRSAFEFVFLAAVLTALGEDHLVLMLDEVVRLDEEVRAGRLEPEVFNYLRHLIQHYDRLNFIFSLGSGLEEMRKDYAFLFSAALYHPISFLEEDAARKLITEPAREYFEVSPDAVDTILRVTSRHPYYTQLVCQSLFDRWSRSPKPAVTAEDVYTVLSEAIELGSANLTYVWEDSSPEEKAVMAAMAAAMRNGPRAIGSAEIRATWRKAGVPLPERKLAAALRNLASREVVMGIEAYSFTVDLQRLWLDKHRRLDWVKDELAESIQQWTHETRTHRTWYLAAAAAAVVVAAYAGISKFDTHWWPFPGGTSAVESSLINAMPGDLPKHHDECPAVNPTPQVAWQAPGLGMVLHCTSPGIPGGEVQGYLFDSFDDLQTAWNSFNATWDPSANNGIACPSGGNAKIRVIVSQGGNEAEECGFLSVNGKLILTWAWLDPSDNGFIVAESATDSQSSYTALDLWIRQLKPKPHKRAPILASGVTPLVNLLPQDIADPATECSPDKAPQWKSPGLVSALVCNDPGLPNGAMSVYQLDSRADYQATWQNFNAWSSFDVTTAGTNCPPSRSGAQGITTWSNQSGFPQTLGQVLECWTGSNAAPIYVWSMPTQDAFIIAVGADGSSFKALDDWWISNSPPAKAPTTTTPSPQPRASSH
jgi:hypothetical protein